LDRLSDDFLKLDVEKAEAINITIYDMLAKANDAIKQAAAKPKGVTPFSYFKGAGGAVVAPTLFSPATTPRIIAGYYSARRVWAQNVANELTGVAVGLGLGTAFRSAPRVTANDELGTPPKAMNGPPLVFWHIRQWQIFPPAVASRR
jgi:hypothetical protein